MYKKLFTLIIYALSSTFAQATDFITFKRNAASDVELTNTNDTVTYAPQDWKGVRIAVANLRQDLKAVTGRENAPVVVGTVGKSKLAKIYLAATMGDTLTMQTLFERDKQMTHKYNKVIAGGKWDGMMLDKHIGYRQWSMPNDNTLPQPNAPYDKDKAIVVPNEIAIMAHDYTRRTQTDDAQWTFLPGLGCGKGNMGIEPVTAKSRPDGDGATLEYDVTFDKAGKQKLTLGILPTNDVNPGKGLRIGIRIDNGEMQTIDARQGYVDTFNEYTRENIARSKVLKPLP